MFIGVIANRKENFADIITQKGIALRWYSSKTELKIHHAKNSIEAQKSIWYLERQDPQYSYALFVEEWEEAKTIWKLLKVFYDATNVIYGSNYRTTNK